MVDLTTQYISDSRPLTDFSVLVPLLEIKTEAENYLNGVTPFARMDWATQTLVQLAGDKLTATQSRHTIRPQGAGATDDLKAVIGDIDILVIHLADTSKAITVRHNATFTGAGRKIFTHDGYDIEMNNQNKTVVLYYNSAQTCYSTDARVLGSVWWNAAADAQMSADTISAAQSKLKLVTEGGTTLDELATVTNSYSLDVIVLAVKNIGYTVTVKHGAGNIWFESGIDATLDSTDDALVLVWDNANARWTVPAFTNSYSLSIKSVFGISTTATQIENSRLKYHAPPEVTNVLDILPSLGRRKQYHGQIRSGTTLDNMGMPLTISGIASASENATTRYLHLLQPASGSSSASCISTDAPFNLRYSPIMTWNSCFMMHNRYDIVMPDFIGLMTGLPSFTGTVVGGTVQYTINYTGISGMFWAYSSPGGVNFFVYDNGTSVASYTGSQQVTTVPKLGVRRIGYLNSLNTFFYEPGSGYRYLYTVSPSGALLAANLKMVFSSGNYYASDGYLEVSAFSVEQD